MQRSTCALAAMLLAVGCAREVALVKGVEPVVTGTLDGGTWAIEAINGAAVIAGPRVEIGFTAGDGRDGRVAGTTGCNRFNGAWRQSGDAVEIGVLATTRRGCLPDAMEQEEKLLGVLAAVRRVYFAAGGKARLVADDGRQLALHRTDPPTVPKA